MTRSAAVVFVVTLFGVWTGLASSQQAFTAQELQCFSQHKVLFGDNKCYSLHQVGPCLDNEWLVYQQTENVNVRPTAVCKARPCNLVGKPIYWPADEQCHKLSDSKILCPYKRNMLKTDSYGNGECGCAPKCARFETEVQNGRKASGKWQYEGDCYPLFHRGPCPRGKLLYPQVLEGFGLVATCAADFCAALNDAADPGTSYVMREEDLKCYRLESVGAPCATSELFDVHPTAHLPQCYSTTTSLFGNLSVRCGGAQNINATSGECRKRIVLKTQAFGFENTRYKPPRPRVKPRQRPNP